MPGSTSGRFQLFLFSPADSDPIVSYRGTESILVKSEERAEHTLISSKRSNLASHLNIESHINLITPDLKKQDWKLDNYGGGKQHC